MKLTRRVFFLRELTNFGYFKIYWIDLRDFLFYILLLSFEIPKFYISKKLKYFLLMYDCIVFYYTYPEHTKTQYRYCINSQLKKNTALKMENTKLVGKENNKFETYVCQSV